MHISLTPELEKMIKDKVKSGMYNNASEVVREALRSQERLDNNNEAKLSILKAEIQKGIDDFENGNYREFNFEEIMKEIREKRKRENRS